MVVEYLPRQHQLAHLKRSPANAISVAIAGCRGHWGSKRFRALSLLSVAQIVVDDPDAAAPVAIGAAFARAETRPTLKEAPQSVDAIVAAAPTPERSIATRQGMAVEPVPAVALASA